jgi:hypothetical protein
MRPPEDLSGLPVVPALSSLATLTCSCCTKLMDVIARSTLAYTTPRSPVNLSPFVSMEDNCYVSLAMESSSTFSDCDIFSTRNSTCGPVL